MNNYTYSISILLLVILSIAGCGDDKVPELVTVTMETSMGDIVIELDPAQTPVTVENFLTYVRDGFYDSTLIHRVIPRFVIQGGGYDERRRKKETRGPIKNESSENLLNKRGTIAMARLEDPDSATSQFFINLVDNIYLDNLGYAVFGRVIDGMEVVDTIAALETHNIGGAFTDLTYDPVIINTIRIHD